MKTGIRICLFLMLTFHLTSAQKGKNGKVSEATKAPKEKMVEIVTSLGTIKVKLYNETPQHRDNFIKLVNDGFYNGTLFHRVIKGFMIQGGDPDSKNAEAGKMLGAGGVGYKVPAEFNDSLIHKKGALAAARDNNPERASSGCQFYIVQGKPVSDQEMASMETRMGAKYSPAQKEIYKTLGGTPFLDKNYTVFGEVVEGLDVLDKIESVPCGQADRPVEDVKMISVKVIN
ncbi:peptidylprolyl isomerase [soil metagenome]